MRTLLTLLTASVLCSIAPPSTAAAVPDPALIQAPLPGGFDVDVTLGCVVPCSVHHPGILRLLYEVRRRTSVAIAPLAQQVDWGKEAPETPLVLWSNKGALPWPSPTAQENLACFLRSGGTLLVDADDADANSPFVVQVQAVLRQLFGPDALRPVPATHVLYKTFYLAQLPQGRAEEGRPILGLFLAGRLAVIFLRHDVMGAIALAPDGSYVHPVPVGQDRRREMDLRFAVNVVMLALCGDYKDDHVHLPFILRRRQG